MTLSPHTTGVAPDRVAVFRALADVLEKSPNIETAHVHIVLYVKSLSDWQELIATGWATYAELELSATDNGYRRMELKWPDLSVVALAEFGSLRPRLLSEEELAEERVERAYWEGLEAADRGGELL